MVPAGAKMEALPVALDTSACSVTSLSVLLRNALIMTSRNLASTSGVTERRCGANTLQWHAASFEVTYSVIVIVRFAASARRPQSI